MKDDDAEMRGAGAEPGPAERAIAPGTGWPEDPASAVTPVAHNAADVAVLAAGAGTLGELSARQSVCRACPRLVLWREQVAADKRRSYQAERYWGRPVPGWGADRPAILIVGLAPAAHGGNRTGRIFTGDRSGDVLFASLWRCGLAAQPSSTAAGDGQRLIGTRMAAAVRCAPPQNKPSVAERDTCAPWLAAELALVAADLRVIICLGHFAWQTAWQQLASAGLRVPRPRPVFGHGTQAMAHFPAKECRQESGTQEQSTARAGRLGTARAGRPGTAPGSRPGTAPRGRPGTAPGSRTGPAPSGPAPGGAARPEPNRGLLVIGCYHPSQQNTFTGRVTDGMLDAVFRRAADYSGL